MIKLAEKDFSLYKEKIQKYKNTKGPLLPILHIAQDMFGHIPIEIQEIITEEFKFSNAKISGVVSFYEFFHTEPTGKIHIGVCTGTTCHINGSSKILEELENILGIEEGQTTKDGQFTIIPVKCIGNCDTSPNMTINNKVYQKVTINDVSKLIEKYNK
jgi:NADH:ubiquinone oxidoreductase subunit E